MVELHNSLATLRYTLSHVFSGLTVVMADNSLAVISVLVTVRFLVLYTTFHTGLILEACSVKPSWFLKKNTKPYFSKIKYQVTQSLFDLDLPLPKPFYNLYDTR